MFKYRPVNELIIEERNKRKQAEAKLLKATADLNYVAMMCDVELEIEDAEVSADE